MAADHLRLFTDLVTARPLLVLAGFTLPAERTHGNNFAQG